MPFELPNWMQNDSYSARLDRMVLTAIASNEGIVSGYTAAQRGAGANMSIDIGIAATLSQCYIQGDDQANQGMYLVTNTGLDNVAISAAPGSNSRITIVFVRVNDPNATGPAGNNAAYGTVDGATAASPVDPAIPTSALALFRIVVPTGTAAITTAMIQRMASAARIKGSPPFGALFPYMGVEAGVPADHVLCRGQAISRTTYYGLFDVLGTIYGAGDGSTTFNVPDLRGKAPVGLDNMGGSDAGILTMANTLGLVGGEEKHVIITAEMAAHTHSGTTDTENAGHTHGSTGIQSANHTHYWGSVSGGNYTSYIDKDVSGLPSGISRIPTAMATANTGIQLDDHTHNTASEVQTHAHAYVTSSIGSGTAHNNMAPYILTNWIMRAL